jgi:Skp family chaperone for outer membrane proteins
MITRSLALLLIAALTLGCGSNPAAPTAPVATEPSLADQLAAAKELEQIAKEEYENWSGKLSQLDTLMASAPEPLSDEARVRADETRSRMKEQLREAEREWNAAKRKVTSLARQIAEP